jgi:hypothetical protein
VEGDVIRLMRWHEGRRAVFARGNVFENAILWMRGYRPHDTLFGFVMAKWARAADAAGGGREG